MDRQGKMEKKNKTLGAERCVNIVSLYINNNNNNNNSIIIIID